ncbi:ROK family protein [Shigella boydii]|nr:ROK family protein [Shigella boydii]
MDGFLHQASFVTGNWCYDRHCSVRLVICFDLAIDQITQSGLSSLKVIYYSAQLFRGGMSNVDRLYQTVPQLIKQFVFGGECETPVRKAKHSDSSGVRGAAWLWPQE